MARGVETRERLIRTAGELFWRRGYAATGVNEIIRRARATSGSFYHFFATKDDLLVAVLERVGERLEDDVLGPADAASDRPDARISALADAYRAALTDPEGGFGLPVGSLIGELGSEQQPARRRLDRVFGALVSRVAGWLDGRGDGADAELVVATLEGAAAMARASGLVEVFDRCADRIRDGVGATPRPVLPEDGAVLRARTSETGDWKAW